MAARGIIVAVAWERVKDEEPIPLRAALPVDALKLRAAREPAASGAAVAGGPLAHPAGPAGPASRPAADTRP